jgi:hypothetical protein
MSNSSSLAPRVISCANDPYNISPPVKAALEEIARVRRSIPKDRPVVVVIGEIHETPTHDMFQLGLLHGAGALSGPNGAAYTVAGGFEQPKDLFGSIVNMLTKRKPVGPPFGWIVNKIIKPRGDLSREIKDYMTAADHDGKRSLMAVLAAAPWRPEQASLMYYCLKSPMSFRFNDVAQIVKGKITEIDKDDPAMKDMLTLRAPDLLTQNFAIDSETGLMVRNMMMAENAMRHIKDTGADIYIQQCGGMHVSGGIIERGDGIHHYKYDKSLCAYFAASDAYVIPLHMERPDESPEHATPDFRAMMSQSIIVEDLAEISGFDWHVLRGVDYYFNKIAKASGTDFEFFNPRTLTAKTDDSIAMEKKLKRAAPQWIAEAEASLS